MDFFLREIGGELFVVRRDGSETVSTPAEARTACRQRITAAAAQVVTLQRKVREHRGQIQSIVLEGGNASDARTALESANGALERAIAERQQAKAEIVLIDERIDAVVAAKIGAGDVARFQGLVGPFDTFLRENS